MKNINGQGNEITINRVTVSFDNQQKIFIKK